jgi:hypothetical protein
MAIEILENLSEDLPIGKDTDNKALFNKDTGIISQVVGGVNKGDYLVGEDVDPKKYDAIATTPAEMVALGEDTENTNILLKQVNFTGNDILTMNVTQQKNFYIEEDDTLLMNYLSSLTVNFPTSGGVDDFTVDFYGNCTGVGGPPSLGIWSTGGYSGGPVYKIRFEKATNGKIGHSSNGCSVYAPGEYEINETSDIQDRDNVSYNLWSGRNVIGKTKDDEVTFDGDDLVNVSSINGELNQTISIESTSRINLVSDTNISLKKSNGHTLISADGFSNLIDLGSQAGSQASIQKVRLNSDKIDIGYFGRDPQEVTLNAQVAFTDMNTNISSGASQGSVVLTKTISLIDTVSNNEAVTLPDSSSSGNFIDKIGGLVFIRNKSATNTLLVFPIIGGFLDGVQNNSLSIAPGEGSLFTRSDTSNVWFKLL